MTNLLHASLIDIGVDIVAVDSFEKALRVCEQRSVEVIITTILSSFLSGADFSSLLRATSQESVPSIFALGWWQCEELPLALLESGIDQYMTLPVNVVRLRTKVTRQIYFR